ncbi:MAG: flagellar biosynthetic protein FliP [Proteobacteria bacterium]|nr:flagellar biosynthetic protein FliP [Pseudomonadota bacterium]
MQAKAHAAGSSDFSLPSIAMNLGAGKSSPTELVGVLRIVLLLTVLTLAPAIIVMMTSFTRVVIVLSFLRQSLGAQQMPPNQVVVGLSLFLSLFIMAPTWTKIQSDALNPYLEEKIDQKTAFARAEAPMREFMFGQVREKDLELFLSMSKIEKPKTREQVPTYVLIPSFIVSELNTAFQMGFMLYLPFLVIDMVVSSILMAMGMMMLPPMTISLPFKLLLFVLVDGWGLVVGSIVKSFG